MSYYDATLLTRIGWVLTAIAMTLLIILFLLAAHVIRHWDDAYEDDDGEDGKPPYNTGS